MTNQRRRKPVVLQPGQHPASVPPKHPPREVFAQAVARGVNVDIAYREAGYMGNSASRRELRCSADVDARIKWLLVQRIEADAQARARVIEKQHDARLRLIERLEAIAYADPRDIVQWDVESTFDRRGNVTGERPVMKITPSRLLTRDQAALLKTVTTKNGGLKFEVNDQLAALIQLAKMFGMMADPAAATVTNTQVNVGQVNFNGEMNALEAARRLAFALAKAERSITLAGATDAPDAVLVEGSKASS
jgi:hypothetical protein